MQLMTWSIHYRQKGQAGYRSVSVYEIAIKQACQLLDEGASVSEVASSGGNRTIGADEIRRIWADRGAPGSPAGQAGPVVA